MENTIFNGNVWGGEKNVDWNIFPMYLYVAINRAVGIFFENTCRKCVPNEAFINMFK